MPTQRPLVDMIPDILEHVDKYQEVLEYNLRIFKVMEGQLRKEVELSLDKEIISQAALARAKERIPSINVMKKAAEKISKSYAEAPTRITQVESDQDVMKMIERSASIDTHMDSSQILYNAQKMCALEPYVQNGEVKMRVLGGHQFLPYSDDPKNPMNMTVFIKLLGSETIEDTHVVDEHGRDIRQETKIISIDLYALYSDNEFMIVDSRGRIREDKMADMGIDSTVNPFGIIPHTYINKSKFELIPMPNQAGLDMSILIPKILADMNYAFQFMSHSIIWTKNADITGAEVNPDALVNLGSSEEGEGDPEIGTIDPKTDIEKGLMLAQFQLSAYLSTEGIKTANAVPSDSGRDASGFSKAMDESDATQEIKRQTENYRKVEDTFWQKMKILHNYWVESGTIKGVGKFSDKFAETFVIRYAEPKALKTDKQKLEEIKMKKDLGLMTTKQALRVLNPEFSEEQLDAWIAELDEENEKRMEEMMMMSPSVSEQDGLAVPEEGEGRRDNGGSN